MIRFEQPETFRNVLEVHVVELVRSHHVVEDRDRRVISVIRTSFPQSVSKSRVIPGIVHPGDPVG